MLNAKELAVSGMFGAVGLIVAFLLGTAIITATGIPATGGFGNIFATLFIAVIGIKIVDKFGAGIVLFTVMGILAIPTLIVGPPGIHKIAVMFLLGLIVDVIIYAFKRSDLGYMLGAAGGSACGPVSIYMVLVSLGLPQADALKPLLLVSSITYAILGFAGAYVGLLVYDKKIKHLSVVQNLKL